MEIAGIYWEWNAAAALWFIAGAWLWSLVRRYSGPHRVYVRENLGFYGHLYEAGQALLRDYSEDKAQAGADKLNEFRDWWDDYQAGRVQVQEKQEDPDLVELEEETGVVDWGEDPKRKRLRGSGRKATDPDTPLTPERLKMRYR